jgi:signal transduction histidine kinase/ligand-binding sensor domain-containing protein
MRTWTISAAIGCLLGSSPARALDSTTHLTQYRHTAWRVQDGSFAAAPNAIAQTADGYIWIGTGAGLVKYDGVRFVPWTPPGQQTPFSAEVYSLLGASDGTLWIGTARRLLSLKNNTISEHVLGRINDIIEDRHHRIWVARSRPPDANGGLCVAAGEQPRCIGGDDRLRLPYAVTLAEDRDGNLWVGSSSQLLQWSEHSQHSYLRDQLARFEGLTGVNCVVAQRDGSVIASVAREGIGIIRVVNGTPAKSAIPGLDSERVMALHVDRDQSVWMGTGNDGIYRLGGERIDRFRADNGLSSNAVTRFFEDREGNVWVATTKGLDRFRDTRVVTFSTAEGLSADLAGSVLAADGRVWIGNMGGLDVIDGSRVTSVRIPGRHVTSLWQDPAKRLWVGIDNELALYDAGEFRRVRGLDGLTHLGIVTALTGDRDGNLWATIVGARRKLARIRELAVQEELPVERIPYARVLAPDPEGGIWLGLLNGQLGHYRNGAFESFPLIQADIPIAGLMVDSDGSVWASSASGLARWKQRVVTTMTKKNGLPCNEIVSAVRDRHQTLWLYTRCGLLAIDAAELERWFSLPDTAIRYRLFDVVDGAMPSSSSFQPNVSVSPDGRLWFANDAVVQTVNPDDLRINTVAPPVVVEALRADRRDYAIAGLVNLPARSRDIEINYTALSFAVPEKVRFRYRLDGRDQEWSDAGTRRQAFYSDLPPGQYRFHVTASNNDGVWNEQGAMLTFFVAPAYYQTGWFLALTVGALVTAASLAYRVRIRIVERKQRAVTALNERLMNAQEQERARIARELHDGVMQEMLAATMMLGTAKRRIAGGGRDAQEAIDKVQQKLVRAGTDLRTLSHQLHPPALQTAGLPQAVKEYCDEFRSASGITVACDVDEGASDLPSGAALALFRITQEALGNAAKHAAARHITVRLKRSDDVARLEILDDGVGFDCARLGTPGGLGLMTMRERAGQLGGACDIESAPGHGTTIRVTVPFR